VTIRCTTVATTSRTSSGSMDANGSIAST
jgi:hypothetical protein